MRAVVDDDVYDTDTADFVCDCSTVGYRPRHPSWERSALFRSPEGHWFMVGQGGPDSRLVQDHYAEPHIMTITRLESDDAWFLIVEHAPDGWPLKQEDLEDQDTAS